MSYYYKYDFISPQPIFAIVKEELKSYFDAGIVDDTFFPIWTDKCLEKLGRAAYEVVPAVLNICDFKSMLPEDFKYVREARMCTTVESFYQLPSSAYEQVRTISTRLDNPDFYCQKCRECEIPDVIEVVYKTTRQVAFKLHLEHYLQPGNIDSGCPDHLHCSNRNVKEKDVYDIRDNKFVTNFREGVVYMQYYSTHYDGSENQMVPDNYRVKEFIEAFIKYKIFEAVFNQTTDETFNQSKVKRDEYKQMADEAYILADIEMKSRDVYRKQRQLHRQRHRLDRYKLD